MSRSVLILDSGIGGLSVFYEISRKLPSLDIDYLADHSYFPYGTKSPGAILSRVICLVESSLKRQDYSLIVIACNTASTVVLDSLRAIFNLPFVGVVPAIKPACAQSINKRVGLLATEGTVTRDYTHRLIEQFGHDSEIELVGSARLVEIAEQKLKGQAADLSELRKILSPFKERQVDQVVLGCTHFPLLKEELAAAADWPVEWVDSGKAIASRVDALLAMLPEDNHETAAPEANYRFYSTDRTVLGSLANSLELFNQKVHWIVETESAESPIK